MFPPFSVVWFAAEQLEIIVDIYSKYVSSVFYSQIPIYIQSLLVRPSDHGFTEMANRILSRGDAGIIYHNFLLLKGDHEMGPRTYKVTSPVMGTFYRSPGPGESPFVEVGQQVEAAEVVCVIESMKIFTELRVDQAGTVKKILVENEEPVMKNQELIEIEIT
jgi:hypothetical protein